jgi:hypothetical protein
MDSRDKLSQASQALKGGDSGAARQILDDIITTEPDNVEAWQMLFEALDNPFEKYDCLKEIVLIHPNDLEARQRLKKYKAGSEYRAAKSIRHTTDMKEKKKARDAKVRKKYLREILAALHDFTSSAPYRKR